MMKYRTSLGVLSSLLAVAVSAFAQTASPPPTPTLVPPTFHAPHLVLPKRVPPAHKTVSHAVVTAKPAGSGGSWIKLNTHLLGKMNEATWVNLAQAANIRFYQAGKTAFAAVGTGGSNYVSTSDPAEIQKLRAYVVAHQTR